jgi:hypothetical protein
MLIERSYARAQFVEQQVWRNHTMLYSQGRLQQASNTSSAFSVTDDCLDASNKQRILACILVVRSLFVSKEG